MVFENIPKLGNMYDLVTNANPKKTKVFKNISLLKT